MTRAVLLPLLLLSACRVDEKIVVQPDGSGKVTLSIATRKQSPDEANRWPELEALERQWGGIAAWSEPRLTEDATWRTATVTGYFEDVNAFRIWKQRYPPEVPVAERRPLVTHTLEKAGGVHTLTIRCAEPRPFRVPGSEQTPRGNRYSRTVTVPGEIVEAKGCGWRKGRSAGIKVDDALYAAVMEGRDEAIERLEAANRPMVVRWAPSTAAGDEAGAFKDEMAAARERWKTLRNEWLERETR